MTSNVDVPFIVSLISAALKDVPADADFLCDEAAVFGDTIKGTLSLHTVVFTNKRFTINDFIADYDINILCSRITVHVLEINA
jgi:hypothetical protein